MAERLVEFSGEVPSGGFRWVQAARYLTSAPLLAEFARRNLKPPPGVTKVDTHAQDRWLMPVASGEQLRGASSVPMRDQPALFRVFAELEATEKAVLTFANKYGWLGTAEPLAEPILLASGELARGSMLSVWIQEIADLRRTLAVWDAIKEKDKSFLEERIVVCRSGRHRWAYYAWVPPDPAAAYPVFDPEELIYDTRALSLYNPELARFEDGGDRAAVARLFVRQRINIHLGDHTAPRLAYEGQDHLRLRIVPKNLLGALWLQFARTTEGSREHRRCGQCRSWFEVSLEAHRTNRQWCSDACRFKAYRGRKARAKEMRLKGIALRRIVKELGSKRAVVRRWTA